MGKRWIWLLLSGLTAGAIVLLLPATGANTGPDLPTYRTAPLARGDLKSFVSSSGTLQAVVTVEVGTQVSGMVASVDADFNSPVRRGSQIALIDPAPFEAALREAEAELSMAEATLTMQRAALEELEAELVALLSARKAAGNELDRKEALFERRAGTAADVDLAREGQVQAEAQVEAGRARIARQAAQISFADAQVRQKEAAVIQRRLELERTAIRSPVDGVVLDRAVNVGQTVAASLQSPVLFRIAEDLSHLEVKVSVDEADIGRVQSGQTVLFSVDAYPGRTFEGTVRQIRKASQFVSNVVTYIVIASASNADGALLPGMTANVVIITDERQNVLRVPSGAVRLRLPDAAEAPPDGDWIWVAGAEGQPRRVAVATGLTNGNETEVAGDGLAPGQRVIIGIEAPRKANGTGWFRFGIGQ